MLAAAAEVVNASDVDALADRVKQLAGTLGRDRKAWVGVAGPPGSGKTTLCAELAGVLNRDGVATVVLPMDGFHYYRKELDAMPNAEEAHAKRGAHWTFDAKRFIDVIHSIKKADFGSAPSFDHALGDPVEDDIKIEQAHRVVLVEGNYLLLPEGPWDQLRTLFDQQRTCRLDRGVP